MTPMFAFEAYLLRIRLWSKPLILVEGTEDQRAVQLLGGTLGTGDITVETAAQVASPVGTSLGNREKVELVCSMVDQEHPHARFVGFTDREFRDFEITSTLTDLFPDDHHVEGRVVWSRGHSIENYLLSLRVLDEPLRVHTDGPEYEPAFVKFQTSFPEVLRIAAALSITGKQLGNIDQLFGSIVWQIFEVTTQGISLHLEHWKEQMVSRQSLDSVRAQTIATTFEEGLHCSAMSDEQTLRWFTHGHIGFRVAWAAYAACLASVSENAQPAMSKLAAISEHIRFNYCCERWVKCFSEAGETAPTKLFELLALSQSRP